MSKLAGLVELTRQYPYTGASAVKTAHQIDACIASWPDPIAACHALAVGLQVNNKTLYGHTNKYPQVFPHPSEIVQLGSHLNWREYHATRNLAEMHLHYFTDSQPLEDQLTQLRRLIEICQIAGRADGLQINWLYPDLQLWHTWQAAFPDSRLILSITKQAMEQANGQPQVVVDQLQPYRHSITDVLFDASGGLGKQFDPLVTGEFIQAVQQAYPHLKIGVAGGLGPNQLQPVELLLQQVGSLSWDAQSKLYHHDRPEMDTGKVIQFLRQSHQLYKNLSR